MRRERNQLVAHNYHRGCTQMTTVKSFMGGVVLATIFQVYLDQMGRDRIAGSFLAKLLALAVVFLVSNLVHWLVFRDPSLCSFQNKFVFSFQLWLFFFISVALNGVFFHRGFGKQIEPSIMQLASFVLKDMAEFGLPFSLLNWLVARWSEPTGVRVQQTATESAE